MTQAIVTYVLWSVCMCMSVSVYLLTTTVSCAKTADPL